MTFTPYETTAELLDGPNEVRKPVTVLGPITRDVFDAPKVIKELCMLRLVLVHVHGERRPRRIDASRLEQEPEDA